VCRTDRVITFSPLNALLSGSFHWLDSASEFIPQCKKTSATFSCFRQREINHLSIFGHEPFTKSPLGRKWQSPKRRSLLSLSIWTRLLACSLDILKPLIVFIACAPLGTC